MFPGIILLDFLIPLFLFFIRALYEIPISSSTVLLAWIILAFPFVRYHEQKEFQAQFKNLEGGYF
jgi:hypothetical protein